MRVVQARAPGRVNLLGEHTDYNDGFVLPCAIAYDTRVRATPRGDRLLLAKSSTGASASFDLDALPRLSKHDWSDYLCGVLAELRSAGIALHGCNVEIAGTVPIGAGLSSSASLEVAFALAMLALADAEMQPMQLALLTQRAEIDYAGMRCGIMDQFTVLHARAGYALFLDTCSLEYEHIAIPAGIAIVVCNTMVEHTLAASAYNERRQQCEAAVAILQQYDPLLRSLRDATPQLVERAKDALTTPLFARARHVVTENERVQRTVKALGESNLERLGELMYASHESLRVDYEVSCVELDLMVELAKRFPGVIGARMTGGGFGGCTVNLVKAARARAFGEYVRKEYRAATGITPEIYDGTPSDGAAILDE